MRRLVDLRVPQGEKPRQGRPLLFDMFCKACRRDGLFGLVILFCDPLIGSQAFVIVRCDALWNGTNWAFFYILTAFSPPPGGDQLGLHGTNLLMIWAVF